MADNFKVGYFLEDRGHEILLKAFVHRIAIEKGFRPGSWKDDVRAARGGRSIEAFKYFLQDFHEIVESFPFDLLIVASDGNCKGYLERRQQLVSHAEKSIQCALDNIVFAIPDPHIERWYMDDPDGFNRALGFGALPVLPSYKCEKGLYKNVMKQAAASPEVYVQFGGYEYGEKIVQEMDIYKATKNDSSLKHFIDDLGSALVRISKFG
jgi:hypothetical protein